MDASARSQLRSARIDAGLSVRELSRNIGISASMLSQIENGHAEPSVSTLYSLVSALSLSLDELLSPNSEPTAAPGGRTADSPLVVPGERAVLVMDNGVRWERLTATADPLVDALLVTYPPGSSSSSAGGLMTHAGREYGFLTTGRLTLRLGFETFHLEPGSSVSFDSAVPHCYVNEGKEPATGLWHVVGRTAPPDG